MGTRRERNSQGQFTETWMLDEPRSDGVPPVKLIMPPLTPPWKGRWSRKKGHYYVDAKRPGRYKGKPPRLSRRPDEIASAVAALEREIQEHGARLATAFSTEQRCEALEIIEICQRLGVRPLDVIREFEKTHPHGPNARTLDRVRIEVVAAKLKQKRSPRHVASLDYRLRTLVKAIGDKPVTAITTQELQDELERHRDWSATTVHSVVQGWKIALNFAIKRGYLVKNPANGLDLPQIIHEEPVVLTLDEARRLLAAVLFADRNALLPACRAYLTIGMFAGVRPEETEKLDWQQINLGAGTIVIKTCDAKCRTRRIVRIHPVLSAWLRPIARARGPVMAHPLDVLRPVARSVLNLPRWPQDVLRHTFASYHFEKFQDEAATKKQIGHRDDGRIFYDHYCRPIFPADAESFWALYPPIGFLPCYDVGWAEANPAVQLALAA